MRAYEKISVYQINKKINHSKTRASLIIKVNGETEEGGIAFVGHMDTVACGDYSQWSYPPHDAIVKGDILYGRGSADMKGGDAAMILALKWMLETKKRPKKSIYFCFTEDEESKGSGICGIVKDGTVNKVDEIIICEPSDEKIGTCEKGAFWLKITVQGKQSHASRPDLGINAVEYVEKLVAELKEQVETGEVHPILGTTTASVTKLCGGIMTNIIPPTAEAELDIRTVPGVSHEHILKCTEEIADRFRKEIPGIQITIEVMNDRPALETSKDSPLVKQIMKTAQMVGISTEDKGHYFYTDASQIIPEISVPFVIAGPGDDALAHCINEHISLESVRRYAKLYQKYLEKYYL